MRLTVMHYIFATMVTSCPVRREAQLSALSALRISDDADDAESFDIESKRDRERDSARGLSRTFHAGRSRSGSDALQLQSGFGLQAGFGSAFGAADDDLSALLGLSLSSKQERKVVVHAPAFRQCAQLPYGARVFTAAQLESRIDFEERYGPVLDEFVEELVQVRAFACACTCPSAECRCASPLLLDRSMWSLSLSGLGDGGDSRSSGSCMYACVLAMLVSNADC